MGKAKVTHRRTIGGKTTEETLIVETISAEEMDRRVEALRKEEAK